MSGTDSDAADAYVADTFGVDPSTYAAPAAAPGGAPGGGGSGGDAGGASDSSSASDADAGGGDAGGDDAGARDGDTGGDDAGAGDGDAGGDDSGAGDGDAGGGDVGAGDGDVGGDDAGAGNGDAGGDDAGAGDGDSGGDDAGAGDGDAGGDDTGAGDGDAGGDDADAGADPADAGAGAGDGDAGGDDSGAGDGDAGGGDVGAGDGDVGGDDAGAGDGDAGGADAGAGNGDAGGDDAGAGNGDAGGDDAGAGDGDAGGDDTGAGDGDAGGDDADAGADPADAGAGDDTPPDDTDSPAGSGPPGPDPVPPVPTHPILGSAQSERAAALLDKLSPEDKTKYQGLLDGAKNDEEKQYLTKALASGHSVADIAAFQQKIAGKDAKWMQDNLSLTGSSDGTGVQQQWSHSCNATTVEAVKGEMDPIYALGMHDANPNMDEVDDDKPKADNPNLAEDQRSMLESNYTGGVAGAGTSGGTAAARDNPSAGAGRWADDLLNKNSDTTGVSYDTKQIGNGASVDDAMKSIDGNVSQGIPVPMVIGNDTGEYTHYVLVTATDAGPPKSYSIHDPYSGETKIRTEAQMRAGNLDIAGSNQITAFENPTKVPVK